MTRLFFPLTIVSLVALLILLPRASTAQDPSVKLLFFEEQSAVLGEQLRNILDRDLETQRGLLDAISDLRATAEAMEAEKNLILNAFRMPLPRELSVLIGLVWELGYQAGTAEMLADEWERLLASTLMQGAPAGERILCAEKANPCRAACTLCEWR